jgi:thioredoxin reductase
VDSPINQLPVAIIGGGPVGLAAGVHLAARGERFVILEGGPSVGAAMSGWGHVRLFSPWRYCIDPAARRLLDAAGWSAPDDDALPTGAEIVQQYLVPLAAHPAIAPHLRLNARVASVGRRGIDKARSADREAFPFELQLEDGSTILARAVIDASGTWTQPNPAGADGRPALHEAEQSDRFAYGIPDVLHAQRDRYAGKRVLVVGSGHSAINNVLDLLTLRAEAPATTVIWAMRTATTDGLYGGEDADELPARGALGRRAREAVESGQLEIVAPFRIRRVDSIGGGGLRVTGERRGEKHAVDVDEVIVATGFRPDLEMLREVRLGLDPALEASATLGPLIDPNLHSCGTVPPHGAAELAHPEPNFFVIGMKSYGRAPTFLMATGFEQARSVAAYLAGDLEASRRVELILPATGVCSSSTDEAGASGACCGTEAPAASAIDVIGLTLVSSGAAAPVASACCGGPAASADACCVQDADAKAAGEAGCGCATASSTETVVPTAH